jgi:hypothetical protein
MPPMVKKSTISTKISCIVSLTWTPVIMPQL